MVVPPFVIDFTGDEVCIAQIAQICDSDSIHILHRHAKLSAFTYRIGGFFGGDIILAYFGDF
jgi:hypothetical protein